MITSASEAPAAARGSLAARPTLLAAAVAAPLAVACVAEFGLGASGLLAAGFVGVLAVLASVDIAEQRLPNRIVLPALAVVLAANVALFPERRLEWVAAALGAAAFFLLPHLLYPAGLGMGDVKLALLLGAMLGKSVVAALLVGCLAAALVAVGLLVVRGRAARKQAIPFGPFLALGAVVALLAGEGAA